EVTNDFKPSRKRRTSLGLPVFKCSGAMQVPKKNGIDEGIDHPVVSQVVPAHKGAKAAHHHAGTHFALGAQTLTAFLEPWSLRLIAFKDFQKSTVAKKGALGGGNGSKGLGGGLLDSGEEQKPQQKWGDPIGRHSEGGVCVDPSDGCERQKKGKKRQEELASDTARRLDPGQKARRIGPRSEEHTSELQSRENLVCRL